MQLLYYQGNSKGGYRGIYLYIKRDIKRSVYIYTRKTYVDRI